MRIQLTADYRGVLTEERFYLAGDYEAGDVMPPAHAKALVDAGRAVAIEADEPKEAEPVKVAKRGRTVTKDN